jgi:hypothetical protein
MASETPNIQLGGLNFGSVKSSLIDYLKTQDTLKDYDYAGSAMQVLLDVLAYNTMYYGHYSNMIANEMFLDSAQRVESIISLVKPLGYVVPGRTSATARVKVRHGTATIIPKYNKFSGFNEAGIPYTFYSVVDTPVDNLDAEAIVNIYESSSIVQNAPLIVDFNNQKGFLSGLDIDISTITIEVVNTETGEWEPWTLVSNVQSGLDGNSKVYWLERTELGFFIVFGGNVGSSQVTQIGQQIVDGDAVRVSYLRSSGSVGNGVGSWSIHGFPDAEVESLTDGTGLSSGGTNEPNLDMIKFFAPKWFAAQDRAVTVEDCKALLAARGFVGDAANPYERFNVWGGEEEDPPMYGRVFVSVNEEGAVDLVGAAGAAISVLKDKTCVTILPEFVNPEYIVVRAMGNIPFDGMLTELSSGLVMSKIIETLTRKYSQRFNRTLSTSEISNIINEINPALSATSSDLSLTADVKIQLGPDGSSRLSKIHNSLLPDVFTTSEFGIGTRYSSDPGVGSDLKIRLRINQWIDNETLSLEGWYVTDTGLPVIFNNAGTFNPLKGEINIFSNVSSEPFTCRVSPTTSSFKALRNIVSKLDVSGLVLVNN